MILSGILSLLLLIGGVVWLVTWANLQNEEDGGATSIGNSSYAKAERHTPADTSNEAFWTNFIIILVFVTLLSTPACYYAPQYMRRPRTYASVTTPVAEIVDFPLLALPMDGERV